MLPVAARVAVVRAEMPATVFRRTLTFAERVTFQRAGEEVLWRHRIWPTENPGPKPSLGAVMAGREIEKKVNSYLANSQVLEAQWQRPITPADLQAEMERMAHHTRQPEVLRELFQSLENDPFIIAECLARPILAERLLNDLTANGAGNGTAAVRRISTDAREETGLGNRRGAIYKLPKISVALDCKEDTWTSITQANAPDARGGHTAIWTGSEMIIWGGGNLSDIFNTGRRYDPATDSWTPTSIRIGAPMTRTGHTAVWNGREMIVWGGAAQNGVFFNTGGRYDPASDLWTATSTANTPLERSSHTAVWTGTEMIVWGGVGCGGNCNFNSGGRYNPNTDSWRATSINNAPSARFDQTMVWTGREMIVWGGTDAIPNTTYLHTGGRYNPVTDTWTPTSLANVPLGRVGYTAVWTGSEMIIWGGVDESFHDASSGGRYNPGTDVWTPTNVPGAPLARNDHSAVWTGREMIVWGGSSPGPDLNDGKRYDPATDNWTPMTTINAPFPRLRHTAVWTGSQLIVWGGVSFDAGRYLDTGGRYCAQPSTPQVQRVASRKRHGSAGNFDVDLPLSGTPEVECRSGGATGDYTIVVTFLANVSVDASPQATVTSGLGTIGSGGVGNGGAVITSGNVVTIPLTNVANAQTVTITLNNVNGASSVTIPMSVLVGDVNGNGAVNASDVALTKSRSGQATGATNLRSDVNADGGINATDVSLVKSQSGNVLP